MYAARPLKETQRVQDLYMTDPRQSPHTDMQPVSYAYNFKVRLMNADPEQERQKQMVKDLYRKELEKQMIADKQRKQQQLQKIKAEDEKYEREFYQQKQIEAARKNTKSRGDAFLIMRSANERTRRKGAVKPIMPEGKLNPQVLPMNRPVSKPSGQDQQKQKEYISVRQFPRLVVNKYTRDTEDRVLNEYTYEDQRLDSIQHLQQAILRKMDTINDEIRKASMGLQTQKEVDRIRSLLRSKSIYTDESQQQDSMDMYYLSTPNNRRRKASVMENRSLQYYARSANQSAQQQIRQQDESTDFQELYDKVEILPLQSSSKRKKRA